MPNINDAFPSKFVKASDLQGQEPVVVIAKVVMEEVGLSKQIKPVLYFEGRSKGLVLNKTNANRITQLTGTGLTEEWVGHSLKLYATETSFEGEQVECIRIRPQVMRPAAPAAVASKPLSTRKPPTTRAAKPQPEPEPEPEPSEEPPLTDDDIPF